MCVQSPLHFLSSHSFLGLHLSHHMSCTHSILTKFPSSAVPSLPQYLQVTIDTVQYSSLFLSIYSLSFLSTNCSLLAASFSFVCHSLSTLFLSPVSGTDFLSSSCCTFLFATLLGHAYRQCPSSPYPQHLTLCCISLLIEHTSFLSSSHPMTLVLNVFHLFLHNPPLCSLSAILSQTSFGRISTNNGSFSTI